MIAQGCLESPHVDSVLGLHVAGDLPAGQWRYLTAKELEYLQSLR